MLAVTGRERTAADIEASVDEQIQQIGLAFQTLTAALAELVLAQLAIGSGEAGRIETVLELVRVRRSLIVEIAETREQAVVAVSEFEIVRGLGHCRDDVALIEAVVAVIIVDATCGAAVSNTDQGIVAVLHAQRDAGRDGGVEAALDRAEFKRKSAGMQGDQHENTADPRAQRDPALWTHLAVSSAVMVCTRLKPAFTAGCLYASPQAYVGAVSHATGEVTMILV